MNAPGAHRLSIDAGLSIKEGAPPNRIRIEGKGDMKGLLLDSAGGDFLGGRLHGGGNVSWKPAIGWELAIGEKGLNPGQVSPKWNLALAHLNTACA